MRRSLRSAALATVLLVVLAGQQARGVTLFTQTDLVSNVPGLAANTDPLLSNPWGIAHSPTSPWWVADNGSGFSTLYNGSGTPQALVVTIPGGAPTGLVFNPVSGAFNSDSFLFSTEHGEIAGWRGALGTTAEVIVPPSSAIYTGLAIAGVDGGGRAYAADFHGATVQPINGTPGMPAATGNFVDPTLPAGYAPFNVENINGVLYVTYAQQNAGGTDDVPGPGHGFVDRFDLEGAFLGRLVSNGALNSPWGMALAPAGFGDFGGDLLVGNFGDGMINAYDPTAGTFLGTLRGTNNSPLAIPGLWGLEFGNGASAGDANTLFFSASLESGVGWAVATQGVFGSLAPSTVPEPVTASLALLAGLALAGAATRRRNR